MASSLLLSVCDFRDSRDIQHAAAVLSITSTRAEGEAGALLQTLAQRGTHQRARRPGAALALHVAHEAESALGDHLAGRAVARIAVARDYRLDPSAIRQLAQEEDVVEALLALFPSRACAGFETACPEQGNHRGERLRRHASDFPKSRRDKHLVVNEVRAVGMTQQEIRAVHVLGVDRRHWERQ